VYYVIDNTPNFDLIDGETPRQIWSLSDFTYARAREGNKDYAFLLEFQKRHNLPLKAAASLVAGESAGSGNKAKAIKAGTFKVGDMGHADAVVKITDLCREFQIEFATSAAFVAAVSKALRIPSFEVDIFCSRLRMWPALMRKRGKVEEYLEEIETLYNRLARGKRLAVKFEAIRVARERHETFGRHYHRSVKDDRT
jgi:hypothetical protein